MEKKSISQLLSECNFVVPEIQREYVWGSKKNYAVLEQFLEDLNKKFEHGDANVGFLYSYQSSNSELYLIDGQQRYTTIILLLYSLSVLDERPDALEKLRMDEKLPAFSYRVRSYTESFMYNLLKSKALTSKDVADQKWFKSEYRHDPTINAMLGALDKFSARLSSLHNITFDKVLNHVFFWYFDVKQTSQGEELYITMNSRGEKLTDSEQIKPRLLKKEEEKEKFGKEWDNWEEFFFKKELRNNRDIKSVDVAMNNVVRLVLEMKTLEEHDKIKPVEDAESISLHDIKLYMDALVDLYDFQNGEYRSEITRLYGDSKSDGNFYVLKALLTELIKGQTENHELERVYQTIINQVRGNTIKKHIPFLKFLDEYRRQKDRSFYNFIIYVSNREDISVINGHELDKVKICNQGGKEVEEAIWKEQSRSFWNGEIEPLILWAEKSGEFSLEEFLRISQMFNMLFNETGSKGWTSDNVRQALITRKLKNYPINGGSFGYNAKDWKFVMMQNVNPFLDFLNEFKGRNKEDVIKQMKGSYPETPENKWAEFVHHDNLLEYCNTKHLYWDGKYGWFLVKNSWAQPISVKASLLHDKLWNDLEGYPIRDCQMQLTVGWNSCVSFEDTQKHFIEISIILEGETYKNIIKVGKRGDQSIEEASSLQKELSSYIPEEFEKTWDSEKNCYFIRPVESDYAILLDFLRCWKL